MSKIVNPGWQIVKVGDVCLVGRGSSPRPIKDQEYFRGGNIPWIKIADATSSGKYLYETKQYVNEFGASFSRLLPKGSLIVAASGTLGHTQLLGVDGCVHDGWLYLDNFSDQADKEFLYYLFKDRVEFFYNSAYGAAIQNINTTILREMEILLPPTDTQRKITAVLSAYDDLIENNTRRIAILEEMAQALYREWFVHFRFPGHESVALVEGGNGRLPEGWSFVDLETLYITSSGGTPSRKIPEYFGGEVPWVKTQELHDNYLNDTDEKVTQLGLKNSSAKVFPENTVIIAMYGATIGQLGILAMPAATNQACCALLNFREPFNHVYAFSWLKANREYILSFKMGAAQQNISQKLIKTLKVLRPPDEIVEKFNKTVGPMFQQIKVLQQKNANLRQTRDLLLPRLISGELDVSHL